MADERSSTAPSRFSNDVQHVHCLSCNAPVPIIYETDPKYGYVTEGRPADHACSLGSVGF
jgi:hypothetical protein